MTHTRILNMNSKQAASECVTLKVGDLVKSYDFEDTKDCYYVGVIYGVQEIEGCDRYLIKTTQRGWPKDEGGVEVKECVRTITPPVNGTEIAYRGRFTNFVEKVG